MGVLTSAGRERGIEAERFRLYSQCLSTDLLLLAGHRCLPGVYRFLYTSSTLRFALLYGIRGPACQKLDTRAAFDVEKAKNEEEQC
jgi:hypothetical protein